MIVLIVILGCISITTATAIVTDTAATVIHENETSYEDVVLYLQKYGYLDENLQSSSSSSSAASTSALKRAISLFQEYYQLPGDGTLNEVTLQLINKPRCGLPDIPRHTHFERRWPQTHLTWNFYLADRHTIATAEAAFALWADHSPLTFERKRLNPNILISYRHGVHTFRQNGKVCPDKLDGPGNVLAHAFYPTGAFDGISEVHMDQMEKWYINLDENPPETTSLLQTLTHEIGHSLGLSHGSHNDSIMFPFTTDKQFPLTLGVEDILAIQQLYGEKKEKNIPTTTTTTTSRTTTTTVIDESDNDNKNKNAKKELCNLRSVDTVLTLDQRMFVTYGRQVWSIDINNKTYEKPLLLRDFLSFLPDNFTHLQAAYQRPSGEIVIIVNDLIYMIEYPSFELIQGWPRATADIRLPRNAHINTAINTNKGRTFIIFNNDTVAELNECSMQIKSFRALQAIFPGIPSTITLGFRNSDGNLYFINERQYYKFNEFSRMVKSAGEFNLNVIGVECPRDGIIRQLRKLVDRLVESI